MPPRFLWIPLFAMFWIPASGYGQSKQLGYVLFRPMPLLKEPIASSSVFKVCPDGAFGLWLGADNTRQFHHVDCQGTIGYFMIPDSATRQGMHVGDFENIRAEWQEIILVHEFLTLGMGGWAIADPFAEITVTTGRKGNFVDLGLPKFEGWQTMTRIRKVSDRRYELSNDELSVCIGFPDSMHLELLQIVPKPPTWNPQWKIFVIRRDY